MTLLDRIYEKGELAEVSAELLPLIAPHRIILFSGDLGAGKTTLIREICRQLECVDNVSSPTFSIINTYLTKYQQRLVHMDLYRISGYAEAMDAGVEDYLYSNDLCFVEWPEKADQLFPENCLFIHVQQEGDDRRRIRVFNQKNG